MPIDGRALREQIAAQNPLSETDEGSALDLGLRVLGSLLFEDESSWLASQLDEDLVVALRAGRGRGSPRDLGAACREVASAVGVGAGHVLECVQIVAQALSALSSPLGLRLARALPELEPAFDSRDAGEPPPEPDVQRRLEPASHTLAGGRPGGSRPLSEACPGSRHPLSDARPERAHQHSVVRSDNPHGDTKLSSSSGLTQEREGESLADDRRRR